MIIALYYISQPVCSSSFRPDAVALADSFGYSDAMLSSDLGSYDGNVYDRLYESAKQAAVNKYQVHNS